MQTISHTLTGIYINQRINKLLVDLLKIFENPSQKGRTLMMSTLGAHDKEGSQIFLSCQISRINLADQRD